MPQDPVPLDTMLDPKWVAGVGIADPDGGAGGPGRRPWLLVLAALVVLALVAGGTAVLLAHRGGGSPARSTVPPAVAGTASPDPATTAPSPQASLAPTAARLALGASLTAAGPAPSLPWPRSGQADVVVAGIGSLGHSGSRRAVPIASITKVMTAYTVLRDHPLAAGRAGPTIVITAAEAAKYPAQLAAGESLVKVAAGEKLTQRQAMAGLLIASGDNMAEILARWDAGSVSAFVAKMNRNAARLGMSSTHYADPSGLESTSVSTASDLVKLAPVALAEPVLAELVGTSSAGIPLNPKMVNYNTLLGRHGVFGIKTGSTSAAGGCLLFAAHRRVSGVSVTIYGAVLGIAGTRSSILSNARDAGDALVVGAGDVLHRIIVVHAGSSVATLVGQDGTPIRLTVAQNLTVTGWSGQRFGFSLPATTPGQVPAHLIVHLPTRTLTLDLVTS